MSSEQAQTHDFVAHSILASDSPSLTSDMASSSRAVKAGPLRFTEWKCPSLSYRPSSACFDTQIGVSVNHNGTSTAFLSFRGALTSASGYFECALSGRWASNNGNEMNIDEDPKIFQYFLNFAHTGQIMDNLPDLDVEYVLATGNPGDWPVALKSGYGDAENVCQGPKVTFNDLVELYSFADRRDAAALSDYDLSLMLEKILANGVLPVEVLGCLLTNTAAGLHGGMCQMLVEVAARVAESRDFTDHADDLPKEFYVALVVRQREIMLDEQLTAPQRMSIPYAYPVWPWEIPSPPYLLLIRRSAQSRQPSLTEQGTWE